MEPSQHPDMTYKKKLIEVALPLEAINAACKADKARKTGTIRNLHKWFAPMPIPALRAMIFAGLVDDPDSDEERLQLLDLIARLVDPEVDEPRHADVENARRLIERSVGSLPTVLDPFCGGGSTIIEAQRLGLPAIGADLNPVPATISRALTELVPLALREEPLVPLAQRLHATPMERLSADVEHFAQVVYERAAKAIGDVYPLAPNGDPVFAWWWARTVESPDPRFQGHSTPLVTAWWLTKHKGAEQWLEPEIGPDSAISFRIRTAGEPGEPSKSRCLLSGSPIPFSYIRGQGKAGKLGTQMLAYLSTGASGRVNHEADAIHISAALLAQPSDPPSNRLPDAALGFRVQGYGMERWSDLHTPRQLLALETFGRCVAALHRELVEERGPSRRIDAVCTLLGLALGKLAQLQSTLVGWGPRNGPTRALTAFSQQTVSMTWDFCEVNPFGGAQGDWMQTVKTSLRALSSLDAEAAPARVVQSDAREAHKLSQDALVVTDPPYYSAIAYADLSDYFYPWLRIALKDVLPDLYQTISTPKAKELIADPADHESEEAAKQYFLDGFTECFSQLSSASRPGLPLQIVYAHKETESEAGGLVSSGWEALLQAAIAAGLMIVATWPINGSASDRARSRGSNALSTYVVLVCRPREGDQSRTTRRELADEIRLSLAEALPKLQDAAILPVDLAQAVLGPGMAAYTRYARVLEPDGTELGVREALLLINRMLGEVLEEQEGDFDAETRWATAWFAQHQHSERSFGEADSLARSKVTSVDGLVRAGIVKADGGVTRLLPRDSLPDTYDPREDQRPTVWEGVQHLIKRLASGEIAAAELLAQMGSRAEAVRELAYRLYQICDKRGWSEEAQAYNQLIGSWPEIARLAAEASMLGDTRQQSLL